MKKTKDRHLNYRHERQHGTWFSCLKRAGVLCLCMIVLITSDSRVMQVFTVRAEDENNLRCVITSFSPLPDEAAEQTVCTGTSVEKLYFPDTLEVVCTYENDQEYSSDLKDDPSGEDDKVSGNPDESDETSEQPNEDNNIPEKTDQDDTVSDQSGEGDKAPEETDQGDNEDQSGEGDKAPEEPNQGDNKSDQPGEGDKAPEESDQEDKADQSNEGDKAPEESDQGDKTDQPDENDKTSEETNQGNKELDQGNKMSEESDRDNNKASGQPDETTDSATVYADKIDEMILAVKEKMFSFLNSPISEETQVFISSNLSKYEVESEVQILTNTVIINPVSWECIFEYDSETAGSYIFTPILPEGYILSEGVFLPEILVMVVDSEEEPVMAKNKALSIRTDFASNGSFGSGLTWTYDNGILTISGTGSMDNFDKKGTPWDYYEDMIKTVKIEKGVTNIGSYAFFDCSLLDSVEIPGSVISIGISAFHGCSALKSVIIPSGVTSIGNLAFYGCSALDSLTISNTVTSIGNLAFNGCSSLKVIEIPGSVESVTAYAFRNCSGAFLYYPAALQDLGTVKETRANISYTSSGDGHAELCIVRLASDISEIRFPEKVGGGMVWAANWKDYPSVTITHVSYPEHRYVGGVCAICGCETEPEILIDYDKELLVGFDKGKTYIIDGKAYYFDADSEPVLDIDDYNWFGQTISIAKQSTNQTAGKEQKLEISARPNPPDVDKEDVIVKGGSGKLINVNIGMEYQKEGDSGWTPVKGTTVGNLAPGTYYVRIAAVAETSESQGAFCSLPVSVTIEEYELEQELMPKAEIDYIEETLKGLKGGAEYHIGVMGEVGSDMTASANGTIKLSTDWFGPTLAIVKKGDGTNTKDSVEQPLKIPERPNAPANTGKTDATDGNANGTLTGVSSAMVYRKEGTNDWLEITGSTVNNLAPGRYEIRYKAKPEERKFASEIVVQIIASAIMSQEPKPTARIDYKEEQLIGLRADEGYMINGVSVNTDESGRIEIEEGWIDSTISIVKEGNQVTTSDSKEQVLLIPKRLDAPTGVKAIPVSAIGASDGKLINVDSKMEYLSEDAEKGKPISGKEVKNLPPGIYIVYYKATQTSFCSEGVELVVQDAVLKPETIPTAKIDYKEEKLTGLKAGAAYVVSDDDADLMSGELVYADTDKCIEIKEEWMRDSVIYIVKIGDDIRTHDSEAQKLNIPARPSAPEGISTVNESKRGAKDGKLTNVKNTMVYRKEDASKWTEIKGNVVNKLSAGVYYVREKAVTGTNGKFSSDSVTCIITANELMPEAIPDPQISYYDECFMYLEPRTYYTINGKKVQADDNGEIPIKSDWMQGKPVSIIKVGDKITTKDSPAQTISVPKRRSAPTDIKAVSESAKNMNDGKLTNVNSEMQYRRVNVGEWIQIDDDTLEGLEPGKYKVRYGYTADNFVSKATNEIIVYAYGEEPQEQDKSNEDDSDKNESSENQQTSESDNSDSSQSGGAAGSRAAGKGAVGNQSTKDASTDQLIAGSDSDSKTSDDTESDTNKKMAKQTNEDNKKNIQNDENATDIREKSNTQDSNNKEGTDNKSEGLEQSKNNVNSDDADTGRRTEQYENVNAYTTEHTADKLSEFYEFILKLSDSKNLIWIVIILAEPIIFLLILIYALNRNRKQRDKEWQIEN